MDFFLNPNTKKMSCHLQEDRYNWTSLYEVNQAHLRKETITCFHLWGLDFIQYIKLYMSIWHKKSQKASQGNRGDWWQGQRWEWEGRKYARTKQPKRNEGKGLKVNSFCIIRVSSMGSDKYSCMGQRRRCRLRDKSKPHAEIKATGRWR